MPFTLTGFTVTRQYAATRLHGQPSTYVPLRRFAEDEPINLDTVLSKMPPTTFRVVDERVVTTGVTSDGASSRSLSVRFMLRERIVTMRVPDDIWQSDGQSEFSLNMLFRYLQSGDNEASLRHLASRIAPYGTPNSSIPLHAMLGKLTHPASRSHWSIHRALPHHEALIAQRHMDDAVFAEASS